MKGYQHLGTETHNVFVDPMHIGAFTNDGEGAIRVLQYFVYGAFTGSNDKIYHSSAYAKKTDEQYEQMVKEAVEETQKKIGKLESEMTEAGDLA